MRLKWILAEARITGIEFLKDNLAKITVEISQGENNDVGLVDFIAWDSLADQLRGVQIGTIIKASGYTKYRQATTKDNRQFQAQDFIIETLGIKTPRQSGYGSSYG